MQCIITQYLPASLTRPQRIRAKCDRGGLIISQPIERAGDPAHVAAAQALADKFVKEDGARYPKGRNPWSWPRAVGFIKEGQ